MKTYTQRTWRLVIDNELHEDRLVIRGLERFGRRWESTFRLQELSPYAQRLWSRSSGYSAVVVAVTLLGWAVFTTASHTWWRLPDGALIALSICFFVIGGGAFLLNPFRTQWATFNFADGRPAVSIGSSQGADASFEEFIVAVQEAVRRVAVDARAAGA